MIFKKGVSLISTTVVIVMVAVVVFGVVAYGATTEFGKQKRFFQNLKFWSQDNSADFEVIIAYDLTETNLSERLHEFTGDGWSVIRRDKVEAGDEVYLTEDLQSGLARFYETPRKGKPIFMTPDYSFFEIEYDALNFGPDYVRVVEKNKSPFVFKSSSEMEGSFLILNFDDSIIEEQPGKERFYIAGSEVELFRKYNSPKYAPVIGEIIAWRDQIFKDRYAEHLISFNGKKFRVDKIDEFLVVDLNDPAGNEFEKYNSYVAKEKYDFENVRGIPFQATYKVYFEESKRVREWNLQGDRFCWNLQIYSCDFLNGLDLVLTRDVGLHKEDGFSKETEYSNNWSMEFIIDSEETKNIDLSQYISDNGAIGPKVVGEFKKEELMDRIIIEYNKEIAKKVVLPN